MAINLEGVQIDEGIRRYLEVLVGAGVETFESCQGGPGHAYEMPTIRFHGSAYEGYRVLALAMEHGLPVHRVQRVYPVVNGELEGPSWEIVFKVPHVADA